MTTSGTSRKKMQLGDYSAAQKTHQIITNIVKKVLATERPKPRYGTVVAPFNPANQKVAILINGDETPSQVTALPTGFPLDVGSVVSVKGPSGQGQQVEDIFTGRRGIASAGLLNPTLIGGLSNGYGAFSTAFVSNLGQAPAGSAWYLGQWTSPNNIGWADVSIAQGGSGSEVITLYRFPILFNETLAGWRKVEPISNTFLPSGALQFQLEASIGSDPITSNTTLDLRVRQLALDTAVTQNMQFEMTLHGWWVQSNSTEAVVTSPTPVSLWLPTNTTSPFRTWQVLDTASALGTTPAKQNLWADYDGGIQFGPLRYILTRKGKVHFQGLIALGASAGTTVFTLPTFLWPDSDLVFDGNSVSGSGEAEIRIFAATGIVQVSAYNNGASNGYVSMDKIEYFPASSRIPWTAVTPTGAWVNFGGTTSAARYYIDEDGMVHWTGLVKSGAIGSIILLSGATAAAGGEDIWARQASGGLARVDTNAGAIALSVYGTGGTNAYVSLDGIVYPNSSSIIRWFTGVNINYANSFTNLGSGLVSLRFSKDSANVVRMSGVITNAVSTTTGAVITLPATYRPAYQMIFDCIAGGIQCRVDVNPAGTVSIALLGTGGNTTYAGLADLHWIAEA